MTRKVMSGVAVDSLTIHGAPLRTPWGLTITGTMTRAAVIAPRTHAMEMHSLYTRRHSR